MTINHIVRREDDIQLAIIDGAEVEALCGDRFIPTVIVGSSGRAADPAAPDCETCEEIQRVSARYHELSATREWLRRAMNDLNAEYHALRSKHHETVSERQQVLA